MVLKFYSTRHCIRALALRINTNIKVDLIKQDPSMTSIKNTLKCLY